MLYKIYTVVKLMQKVKLVRALHTWMFCKIYESLVPLKMNSIISLL